MTTLATLSHHRALPVSPDLDLIDGDRVVGWITGNAVGFRGFADEVHATHAAWLARRAIARRSRAHVDPRSSSTDGEPLALQRRGDEEVILASGVPIARLIRPSAESPSGADSFGFEIEISPPAGELKLRSTAYSVYRSLRRSGIPWTH
jgi:hypothetical protein